MDSEAEDNENDSHSSDDDDTPSKQTPDMALPRTPSSAGQDRGSLLSPIVTTRTPTGTSSRGRSPVEKLEKLIELYEGSCSVKEYNDYVKPEDEEEEAEELVIEEKGGAKDAALKLETISESIEEEIRILKRQDSEASISGPTPKDETPTPLELDIQTPADSSTHPKSPSTPTVDVNSNHILREEDVRVSMNGSDGPEDGAKITSSGIGRTSVNESLNNDTDAESDSSSDS